MSPDPAAAAGRPTFLIIGAARSGTTYLARHLARHPDVSFSDPKETHFLAFPGQTLAFTGPGDAETINRVAITDPTRWHALFDDAPARGEGSVSTMYHPEVALATIAEHCPDVRLIAVLREPVDRAYSAWLYQVGRGFETASFTDALADERRRIDAGWHHIWHYEAMGHYAAQLRPFLDAVGRDRLLVLDHGDVETDPGAALDRCFAFVGVSPQALSGLDAEVNRGGQPRSQALAGAMAHARRVEPLRQAVKKLVPFAVRERIRSANLDRPPMPSDARDRLRSAFADEGEALVALLGDDAPRWAKAP